MLPLGGIAQGQADFLNLKCCLYQVALVVQLSLDWRQSVLFFNIRLRPVFPEDVGSSRSRLS